MKTFIDRFNYIKAYDRKYCAQHVGIDLCGVKVKKGSLLPNFVRFYFYLSNQWKCPNFETVNRQTY